MHKYIEYFNIATAVITGASFAANCLPPWENYGDYPRFQKFYKVWVVGTVAAIAINLRHRLPSLDIPAPALGINKPPQQENPHV